MTLIGYFTILTIFLCFLAPSFSQDVKLTPSLAVGVDGQPFSWNCELVNTNLKPSQIRWMYNNQYVISEGRKQVMTNGTLAWSAIRKEDEGAYQCEVRVNSIVYKSSPAAFRLAYLATAFTTQPVDQMKRVGETVTFSCSIFSLPAPVFAWYFNGIPLSTNLFRKTSDLQSELTIVNLSYNRAGKYTCRALNTKTGKTLMTRAAALAIQGAPQWVSPPTDQRVEAGTHAIINCLASSVPAPRIAWTRVDKEAAITGQEPEYTIFQNGSLRVDTVSLVQQGTYRCEVTNGFGKIQQTATLLVARFGQTVVYRPITSPPTSSARPQTPGPIIPSTPGPTIASTLGPTIASTTVVFTRSTSSTTLAFPRFTTSTPSPTSAVQTNFATTASLRFTLTPNDTDVIEGRTVSFQCVANRNAVVSWAKVGGALVVGRMTQLANGILRIQGAMTSDSGSYTCTAVASPQTISHTVKLRVRVGPWFSTFPSDVVLPLGNNLMLNCSVRGDPTPTIYWILPSGESASASKTPNPRVAVQGNRLLISTVTSGDAGKYTCVAVNTVATASVTVTVNVAYGPVFSVTPVDTAVVEGGTATLHCNASGYPPPVIEWTPPRPGLGISLTNGSLLLTNVRTDFTGSYQCRATTGGKSLMSAARVSVLVKPKLASFPTMRAVQPGDSVMLHCVFTGIPTPTFRWLMTGDQPLKLDTNMVIWQNNNSLAITSIRESQFGRYSCVATNKAGEAKIVYTVYAKNLPTFVIRPSNTTGNVSTKLEVGCNATGTETPVVKWYRLTPGSQAALPITSRTERVHVNYHGTLLFTNVEAGDEGWYQCVASNSQGNVTAPIYVQIQGKPAVSIYPTALIIRENRAFQLVCRTNGSPFNSWRWRSPTGEVSAQKTSIQENSLVMSETSANVQNHYGPWTCVSCSVVGCNNATVNVTVEGRPIVRDIVGTDDPANNRIMIRCVGRGYPTPKVTYSVGGQPISDLLPPPGHSIVNEALYINKQVYQPTSIYACAISNSFGTASRTLKSPSTPTNVRVQATNTSVTLNWNKISTLPGPVTYNIQYTEINPPSGLVLVPALPRRRRRQVAQPAPKVASASGPPFTIQGLNPYARYRLTMTANNALGASTPTTPIFFNTTEGRATAPRNLQATYGGGRVRVKWEAPIRINAAPENIKYQTVYHDTTRNTPLMTKIVPNTLPFMEYLDNIPYGVNIRITVAAINTRLNLLGVPVTTFLPIREPAPLHVPRITTARVPNMTSIFVEWQYPDESRVNIIGFLVRYRAENETKDKLDTVSSASASSRTLNNLISGSTYNVSVAAYNSGGVGFFSPISRVRLVPGVPQYVPIITKAVAQSVSSIYVEWQYNNNRADVLGFKVRYRADGTASDQVDTVTNPSASSRTLNNLASGSTYNVSVAAYNKGGDGVYSSISRVRLVPGGPNTGGSSTPALTLGEVIAVIIGCFAFLFLIILLIFLCCYVSMQRRRQKREKEVESIYSDTKRRVLYNSVGASDSPKDLNPVLYDANSDSNSIYNSEARIPDPELLLVAKELYSASEDSRANTPSYSKHKQGSTLPRSGHVYAEVRKPNHPGHLKVSKIPDVPVDGASEDWVKRVSPQDLNEKPRVIGGRRSRGSSDSHGYNSQSESQSDGLPWVEPFSHRSDDGGSTVKLPRTFPETAWHPVYDHGGSLHGSRSRGSRKIAFQEGEEFEQGSPGSARPMIHGEMFMRPSNIDRDNGITNPLYHRRDSSAALF